MAYTFNTNEHNVKARIASIKWLIGHLSRNKLSFMVLVFGNLLVNALRLLTPYYFGIMIDQAILPKRADRLSYYVTLVLAIGIGWVVLTFVTVTVTNSVSWNTIRDIRLEFFEKIQAKPLRFHNRVMSGDLMALATNDIDQISSMINPGLVTVAQAFVGISTALILSFSINPLFTLALSPFFIVYIYSIRWYNRQMEPLSKDFLDKWSLISRSAQDSIIGVRVVRAFNGESYEITHFRKIVMIFMNTWRKRQMLTARYWPLFVIYFIIGISFVGSVWAIFAEFMSLGELIAINGMLITLVSPTYVISFAITNFQGGLAGGERLFHTMYAYEPEEDDGKEPYPWPDHVKGAISFKDVSFKYEGTKTYTLKNINLDVKAGETVALVGPTGCGKTTLTKLVSRFYRFEGDILLDDVSIRNYSLRDLRRNFGRVEQDIFLFASSIRDNITFGVSDQHITDEKMIEAAKIAQAYDFIIEQEEGYDTVLGERGTGLSGGQRQRIAIARCILTSPPVMILDDSTSAIDSETEDRISKAMDSITKGRTTFLITHRLSAIRSADKIVLLKNGIIEAVGSHYDLTKTSEDYRRIFSKHTNLPDTIRTKKEDA